MGNEFGLQTLWIYELAVNDGVLRVRERKINACEIGMANNKFFVKVKAPVTKAEIEQLSLEDQLW